MPHCGPSGRGHQPGFRSFDTVLQRVPRPSAVLEGGTSTPTATIVVAAPATTQISGISVRTSINLTVARRS